jgi:ribulose-phosphate 3-epimerase
VIISPSLLSANFLCLEKDIEALNTANDLWIHIDVMDGHFVPNLSFGKVVVQKIKSITKHPLDAHFMVSNPSDHIEWWKDVGLHNFTFHWEACTHHDRLITRAKELYPSVGISLNPSTPLSVIEPYLFKKIDLVLLMSVNPGFGGQSFIGAIVEKVEVLNKIKKDMKLNFEIQVDGGVTNQNCKELEKAGATNLVAGSYIFSQPQNLFSQQIASLR